MTVRRIVTAAAATAIASLGVVGLNSSPAMAASDCRVAYTSGGWNAQPCMGYSGALYSAYANLKAHPSNCSTWRLYLVNSAGSVIHSTSAKSCSTTYAELETYIYSGTMRAKMVAFTSSGSQILSIQTPLH